MTDLRGADTGALEPPASPAPVPARTGLVLAGILFTIVLAGIDGTILNTIMPVAVADLGGQALYAWAFAAYMLATAVSMPLWGMGSDRWGRRRTFLAGIAVFVGGSLLCGLAPTMPLFIAARALQGIGAGAIFSLPFIVLGVVFPPARRAKALGVVASAWALSSVAGPLLGTSIVAYTTWRWAFLVNLPVGLVAAALLLRGLPESVGERSGRIDLAGALLAGLAGCALITAFVNLGEGHAGLLEGGLVAAALVLALLFLRQEARAEAPVLPLELFERRGFSAATGAGFLSAFAGFGLAAYLPYEVKRVYDDPFLVGLVVASLTVGWSLTAFASGRVVHRFGERVFVLAGMGVLALALAALAPAVPSGSSPLIAAAACLFGVGMGLMTPAITVSAQNSVEVRRMGAAMGSLQFLRQIGAAVGVGSLGLALRVSGFTTGLAVLLVATAGGLFFATRLPRTSFAAAPSPPPAAE